MSQDLACWCGSTQCVPFSPDYLRCTACKSLVWIGRNNPVPEQETQPDQIYYNQEYWFSHQTVDLGLKDIETRARSDLPERCLYWLKTVMKYRLPPAQVLELGSAHGGFTALLQNAGYEATGLELDPWIADYARQTFGIRMLTGSVEGQKIAPASLDIIVLMDVLEHLPDPQSTLEHCRELLKPDGMLVLQTPEAPAEKTYQDLLGEEHAFTHMLIPKEHIHLFSRKGAEEICRRLGLSARFEPAFFPAHDMFFIGSRQPLQPNSPEVIEKHLLCSPESRLILALLDQDEQLSKLRNELDAIEIDHAARMELILHLEKIIQKQNRVLNWLPHNILRRALRRFSGSNQATSKQANNES
jgi:2-polyprenyl-3-methyl-5-hydroxy-6-metoxy-1,4-benzoquinol methylase